MEFHVIIPVRYNSTRLTGKVLLEIAGKPMVQHVYEHAVESGAKSVTIATDSSKIAKVVEKFGASVCMTMSDHKSGTERLSEAVIAIDLEEDDIVVCLQGDEPLIPAELIRQASESLAKHDNIKVASICQPITDLQELLNPHATKVVLNRRRHAMYFSRSPIPWEQGLVVPTTKNIQLSGNHYRHIGLYAYRVGFLQEYMLWEPCPPENMEALEQLRILWHGGRIHMIIASSPIIPPGVDTQEDLEKVRECF